MLMVGETTVTDAKLLSPELLHWTPYDVVESGDTDLLPDVPPPVTKLLPELEVSPVLHCHEHDADCPGLMVEGVHDISGVQSPEVQEPAGCVTTTFADATDELPSHAYPHPTA